MNRTLVVLSLSIAALAHAQDSRPATPRPFEASRWIVTLQPDADAEKLGEKAVLDTLVFADNTVLSVAGQQQGFPAARFDSAQAWFSAEMPAQDRRSKCEWRGELQGGRLVGTMIATRGEGTIVRYKLDGQRATPVDGLRFQIQLRPEGKKDEPGRADGLAFHRNKMSSIAGRAEGFAPVEYIVEANAERVTLRAEVVSEIGARAFWTAEVRGEEITGTLRTVAKDGGSVAWTFTGKKVAELAEPASRPAASRDRR